MVLNKSIVLGLPQSFGFSDMMEAELQKLGFDVINISFSDSAFVYKNKLQKLINWSRKTFLNDKTYKTRLKFRPFEIDIKQKLQSRPHFDYALIIRPDIYPKYILTLIKSRVDNMIGYQWDGLSRYKLVNRLIPLFDRFFAFDQDAELSSVEYLTNFYFERDSIIRINVEKNNTILFVGSYFKLRMDTIGICAAKLKALHFSPKFYLFSPTDNEPLTQKFPLVHFVDTPIQYNEYLDMIDQSSIIADFLNPVHNGLSFRVLEAIGYSKKLITTNRSVKEYDFYHPNNIFILENDNWQDLEKFLQLAYRPIPDEVRMKYSFSHWIEKVLDYNLSTKN